MSQTKRDETKIPTKPREENVAIRRAQETTTGVEVVEYGCRGGCVLRCPIGGEGTARCERGHVWKVTPNV